MEEQLKSRFLRLDKKSRLRPTPNNEKRKIYTLLLGLVLSASTALAQSGLPTTLAVHRADGGIDYYQLAEQPRTTLQGNEIVVTSTTVSTTYRRDEVKSYTYENPTDGVAARKGAGLTVMQTASGVSVSGLEAGSMVRLLTMDGRVLKVLHVSPTGRVDIATSSLSTGTYLIQTRHQTLKIARP